MSKTATIAAFHKKGREWKAVVAKRENGQLSLIETRDFRAGENALIGRWLEQHAVTEVLGVIPGASVVCRTCQLPNAAPEQLEPALRLQAEAHLLGTTPPHRQGMAVLHAASGETNRCGIIVAWPESSEPELPPISRDVLFTPDIAAVAALLNGDRPAEPILWLDRSSGEVSCAMTHTAGAVFRAARVEHDSSEAWQRDVGRVIAETALNVGHTAEFVESLTTSAQRAAGNVASSEAHLILPDETRNRLIQQVKGTESGVDWWMEYGICIGALLATTDQLAPLTMLKDSLPEQKPSHLVSVGEVLAKPRTAWILACIAVALMAFSPLVFNYFRVTMLQAQLDSLDDQTDRINLIEQKVAMYQAYETNRWPMTKLLSDIACNTPESVDVHEILIDTKGDNATIEMAGIAKAATDGSRAEAPEVLASMQKYLIETGIFTPDDLSWDPEGRFGQFSFRLAVSTKEPYKSRFNYAAADRDYALKSWSERLYGPTEVLQVASNGGASTDILPESSASESQSGDPDEPGEAGEATDTSPSVDALRPSVPDSVGAGRSTTILPPSQRIPQPLTQDEINAMTTRPQVLSHLSEVAKAMKHTEGEMKERLSREFKMLADRNRELYEKQKSGGGT